MEESQCQFEVAPGVTADALKVTRPVAIVWATQMGTVTLHPWPVRCPDTVTEVVIQRHVEA